MMTIIHIVYWAAGFVVLAEALNKLERVTLWRCRSRLREIAKAVAWSLLACGGASVILSPVPSIPEVCAVMGVATMIIRARMLQ